MWRSRLKSKCIGFRFCFSCLSDSDADWSHDPSWTTHSTDKHTVSQNNVPPLDTREHILIFLAEMLPMKQAIKRRPTELPHITCASALPGETGKHFHTNAVSVHCQKSTNRCLISSILLTHTHAAVWLPKSCPKSCFQLGAVGGHRLEER